MDLKGTRLHITKTDAVHVRSDRSRPVFVRDSKLQSESMYSIPSSDGQAAGHTPRAQGSTRESAPTTCIYGSHRSQPNRCTQRHLLLSRTPTATSSSPPPFSVVPGVLTNGTTATRVTLAVAGAGSGRSRRR